MNILITGGNGYIASSIRNMLDIRYNITSLTRQELDITDTCAVRQWFKNKQFDVIIHTAISGGSRLKVDSYSAMDNNLKMYYNLLDNKEHFSKFINIGSGAELYQLDTPYGFSKEVIRRSISEKDGFYNVRVFAVFDEKELSTRFIKANIDRYISKSSVIIHKNKFMDFFYMKDFVSIIKYYLESSNPPKEIDCSYETHYTLRDIAEHINKLSNYTIPIEMNDINMDTNYTGTYTNLGINYIGLYQGISEVYHKLLLNNSNG